MSESGVTAQITTINNYATTANTDAASAIDSLKDMDFPYTQAGPILYIPPEFDDPLVPSQPGSISIGSAPDVNAITEPASPTKPDIKTITDPSLIDPTMPDAAETQAAVLDNVTLGTLFSATMPDVPSINMDLLSLDISQPALHITAPTNWAFTIDDILIADDPMIKAMMDRLKDNIVNGGTGLSQSVENDIWNRDLERNELQLQDSMDKLTTAWAKKGFSLPDGLLAHSLSELQKEYLNKNLDRSREIAVKQAELEQNNLFKSMEIATNIAFKLVESNTRYAELAFKGQEATAKFANEYIDLQIKTYNSMLDEYKARIQVYEGLLRANQLKVAIYKEQIDSELARTSVNDQTVKIYAERNQVAIAKYRGVLDGNKINADIYNTEMQGVAIQENVNEVRVRRYAEMIRAEMSKIERYKVEVDAMMAELGVQREKVQVNKLQVEAWAQTAQAKIAEFNGMIEQFKAVSQTSVSVADLQTRQTEAALRANLAATELNIKLIEMNNRSLQTSAQLRMEAQKAISESAARRAAGAMAASSAQSTNAYSESKTGSL